MAKHSNPIPQRPAPATASPALAAAAAAVEAQANMPLDPQPGSVARDDLPEGYSDPPADEAGAGTKGGDGRRGVRRVPFSSQNLRLELPERQGYKRRWFNDTPGRIDRAIMGGWEHVRDAEGKPRFVIGGVAREGGGLRQYAMEIPIEFYEQDQTAKQVILDKFEEDVRRGAVNGKAPGEDGRYLPMQGDKPRMKLGTSTHR